MAKYAGKGTNVKVQRYLHYSISQSQCSSFTTALSSGQHVSTAWLVDQSKYATEWWDYNSISLAITTSGYTTHELINGIR